MPYDCPSGVDVVGSSDVSMKQAWPTQAAEPHLKRTTSSDSDPGGPTPTEAGHKHRVVCFWELCARLDAGCNRHRSQVQEDRMLNSWSKLFPIHPPTARKGSSVG